MINTEVQVLMRLYGQKTGRPCSKGLLLVAELDVDRHKGEEGEEKYQVAQLGDDEDGGEEEISTSNDNDMRTPQDVKNLDKIEDQAA